MAQLVKVLVLKPHDLSMIPRNHMMKRESTLPLISTSTQNVNEHTQVNKYVGFFLNISNI